MKLDAFQGLDNKAEPNALPKGKLRNAVNVIFREDGSIQFPRPGKTVRYAGNCHSVYKNTHRTLFVEAGALKELKENNTVTTLMASWGSSKTFYTDIADITYCSNETGSRCQVKNETASVWGLPRPPRQPDCSVSSVGGMFAGDYRVTMTWLSTGEESGTGPGVLISVPDGGGIRVSNIPQAPDFVDGFAIYVSSVNSETMYLCGEYGLDISEVFVGKLTDEGATLATQFCFPPVPTGVIVAHHGRIYYPRGSLLYFTEPHNYGVQKADNFFPFDSEIQTVNSCPGVLYVGTKNKFGKVTNIDSDDGSPPVFEALQESGTTKGSESYDPDGGSSYVMSDRGFLKLTPEGVEELTYKHVAMPAFEAGALTVVEYDGSKYLIGAFQEGVQNPLANKQVNIDELARGSL